jgi:hypothetical protein
VPDRLRGGCAARDGRQDDLVCVNATGRVRSDLQTRRVVATRPLLRARDRAAVAGAGYASAAAALLVSAASSVDLPALGRPTSPTSAIKRSSSSRRRSSPGSPF